MRALRSLRVYMKVVCLITFYMCFLFGVLFCLDCSMCDCFFPLDFYMRKSYQFSKWKYGLGGNYIDLTPAVAISPEQGTLQETVSIFCNGFLYKDHVCEHVLTWSLEIFYSHLT